MSNLFPVAQTSVSSLRNALATSNQVRQTAPPNAGKAFLKFDFKNGDYLFGREQQDVTGDIIVINSASFRHGWILWTDNVAQKSMVAFNQALPEQMERNAHGEEAVESRAFEARFADDADTIIVFETSSYGGRKGCDNLLAEIQKKAASSDFVFPKVRLASENYKAKKGGTIYNPIFEVVGWMDVDGNEEGVVTKLEAPKAPQQQDLPFDEPEQAAAPVRRRRVAE